MRSFSFPLFISAPFYGYSNVFKLHREERSRRKDVLSGNRTWDLLHKGCAQTNCAILASVKDHYPKIDCTEDYHILIQAPKSLFALVLPLIRIK